MKTKRESAYTYSEAEEMVNDFAKYYDGNCRIEYRSADCSAFPCPREMDSWGGETCAIYVIDEDSNKEVYAVAYWNY